MFLDALVYKITLKQETDFDPFSIRFSIGNFGLNETRGHHQQHFGGSDMTLRRIIRHRCLFDPVFEPLVDN